MLDDAYFAMTIWCFVDWWFCCWCIYIYIYICVCVCVWIRIRWHQV